MSQLRYFFVVATANAKGATGVINAKIAHETFPNEQDMKEYFSVHEHFKLPPKDFVITFIYEFKNKEDFDNYTKTI